MVKKSKASAKKRKAISIKLIITILAIIAIILIIYFIPKLVDLSPTTTLETDDEVVVEVSLLPGPGRAKYHQGFCNKPNH